ncbi:hypothetical protein EV699_11589 [Plasticicumulans lactativorans]|uniref:Alginate lyase n=1 Tax=Plasticicumulans lactativorans TaxID=1133106 RepID=A0A4R2L002_9GAMM|nr:hypothetical protein [Plasticicumulans lactativorans]TCO80311.1 hypothetical protein EV699_11589 [Plasticicumulans lactativorans]
MKNRLVIASLVLTMSSFSWPAMAAPRGDLAHATADLSSATQAKVSAAVDGFMRAVMKPERSANDLGWDCLAAAALADLGIKEAGSRLADIADEMLRDAVRSTRTGRPIGWSSASSDRSCVSGESIAGSKPACEGPTTVYAFQSGLGIACMARAGELMQRSDLLAAGREVMLYWSKLRLERVPCKECIYFATSDSVADANRYIRNMNIFVAFGAAQLGKATHDDTLIKIALDSVRSDIWERDNGNRGYLGKLDPQWTSHAGEAERIENHSASVALLLAEIARLSDVLEVKQQALSVWRDWATCDNKRCQTTGCKYWAGDPSRCQSSATSAHCAFRSRDSFAKFQCEKFLELVPSLNAYGILAVLQPSLR